MGWWDCVWMWRVMIKNYPTHMEQMSRLYTYIGGIMNRDTYLWGGTPLLEVFKSIKKGINTHYILTPIYMQNGGTSVSCVSGALIGLKWLYRAIKTRRELYRFNRCNIVFVIFILG